MKNRKIILNLGCGTARLPNAINIDCKKLPHVDQVVDLEKFPYPFKENSIDVIHMYFVLEHLNHQLRVMKELHRILKKGGILYIRVPHGSSCYGAWGEFTHKKGYSYSSFDIFTSKCNRSYYSDIRFKMLFQKCKYFLTYPYHWYEFNTWIPHWENYWYGFLIKMYVNVIQFLIDLSPEIFERFWCYWVGGAAEVYVKLQKV